MFRSTQRYRLIVAPVTLAFFFLFAFGSIEVTLASVRSSQSQAFSLVGPKQHYLGLGDSLAFGYQPNGDFNHGYVDYFFRELQGDGVKTVANMGCPGETSSTMINGGCPGGVHKFPYTGAQLAAAVAYIQSNAGQVSPVTLDIGANDVLPDINPSNCTVNTEKFYTDLATVDSNLTRTILPQLKAALTINNQVTGDIALMNYYDPFQNICPNELNYIQILNQHLAEDMSGFGAIVDIFDAFGGQKTPNPNICAYTWICSSTPDIHPTRAGYQVIANTFKVLLAPLRPCIWTKYNLLSIPGMKFDNERARILAPVHYQVRPETGVLNCPPTLSIPLLNR